jgi:hypothetical protein
MARASGRFGFGVVDFDGPPLIAADLRIAPDRSLRLVVLDASGKPRPDVVVWAQIEEGPAPFRSRPRRLAASGADGTATVWHAQALPFWDPVRPKLEVFAWTNGESPKVSIDLSAPFPDRIVVPCPLHGRLRVRGCPYQRRGGPALLSVNDAPLRFPVVPGSCPPEWRVVGVALGRECRLSAPGCQDLVLPGPSCDGEERLVELPPFAGMHPVRVRLLCADGSPCRSQRIASVEADTDAEGHLQVACYADQPELELRAEGRRESVRPDLPELSENGTEVIELGDVRMHADPSPDCTMPIVAQGRLADARTGRPVVGLLRLVTAAGDEVKSETQVKDDGSFQVRSGASGELWLEAQSRHHHLARNPVDPSASMIVALEPMQPLVATILFDADISPFSFTVGTRSGEIIHTLAQSSSMRPGCITHVFQPPEDDTALAVDGLGAGQWQEGSHKGDPWSRRSPGEPLGQVPRGDWHEVAGTWRATVDLRGRLATLSVSTFAGRPWLCVRPAGTSSPWSYATVDSRIPLVLFRGTALEAIVGAHDCWCARTILMARENLVTLPEAARAEVELQGLPADLPDVEFAVAVWQTQRRDPLLEEIDARSDSMPWDGSRATALHHAPVDSEWRRNEGQPVIFTSTLQERGCYIAVPFVRSNSSTEPLLEAATALEAMTPDALHVVIRLDPAKVRAACR